MLYKIKINKGCIKVAFFLTFLIISLSSCVNGDDYSEFNKESASYHELKLSFVIPSVNVATRADDGYEDGINYENLIDINNRDYSIYFFTYEEGDYDGGTLIAQFFPTSLTSSTQADETIYTVTGVVPDELLEKADFRAVVLANWGHNYLDVKEGETTIKDLTEAPGSTFLAKDKFKVDASNLIPFYGVQQYSGITFTENQTTSLEDEVSLLRALAKVEVVLKDDDLSFSEVILHNYNAQGYSAPKDIYLSSQYNHDNWDDDYVQTLHLVNDGKNDDEATEKSVSFIKTQEREVNSETGEVTQYETWTLYIPEYSNQNDLDAAYIEVKFDHQIDSDEPYSIYFKNYESDGTLGENATTWDIFRNNLYRFNVSLAEYDLRVNVQNWGDVFDNTWTFGDMSRLLDVGDEITIEEGNVSFTVTSNDEDTGLTVAITHVANLSSYEIPSDVTFLGYTYTVTCIGSECFKGDTETLYISVPETVTQIEDGAFSGDTGLIAISLHSVTPPNCTNDAFTGDNISNISLYVPEEYLEIYEDDDFWGQFTIYQIEDM